MNNEKIDISVEIKGSVEDVIYKNIANGYIVFNLSSEDGLIPVVGVLGDIAEGENLELKGGWISSPKYGRQFKAVVCERSKPRTEGEIIAYLGSGIIKGVGPAIAKKIVAHFGTESLDIIENDYLRLSEIRGISTDKALYIANEYSKITGVNEVIKFLGEYNLAPAVAVTVWTKYERESIKTLKENPYLLCGEGFEVSFEQIDRMAAEMGFEPECTPRIKAGIIFILRENNFNGHTCLPYDKLCEAATLVLGAEPSDIKRCLEILLTENLVVELKLGGKSFIYLAEYYEAEKYIAKKLGYMLKTSAVYERDYSEEIAGVEFSESIEYEELQKSAINGCLTSNVFILTGGPGTGKTTTLNGVIRILKRMGKRILLCAPTGRAAKRMADLTGEKAKTIHRLLEVSYDDDGRLKFKRNEKNPLPADVIIVDEMSMVDVLLMSALVSAIRVDAKLIMVGDYSQLPSVGAGNVLKDLIKSLYIPTVELKEIFRQAAKSLIITNAHRIVNGEMPVLNDKSNDFFFMPKASEEEMANLVISLAGKRLPDSYGYSPVDDIQILCPTKMGPVGTKELNVRLQAALNPPTTKKAEIKFFEVIFRVGDKVMQIKNDYNIVWKYKGQEGSGIFNGDIGIVLEVDRFSGNITVDFDGRIAVYNSEMMRNLEHAYAVTVHKSQGSEYEAVIMPISSVTKNLLYRNLLYTGVTRAKKLLILIGTEQVIRTMVDNNRKMIRYSLLRQLLDIEMRKDVNCPDGQTDYDKAAEDEE